MNIPYVKEYNEVGEVVNPIKRNYLHTKDNRQTRRIALKKPRFHGNGKNYHLSVTKTGKYARIRQFETDNNGNPKIIENYILK